MKQIILWIWCLPQNIVGLIVKHVTKAVRVGDHYWFKSQLGSVSIGEYVFLGVNHWGNECVLRHEKGHREQSRILGWFYIIVILIPSLIHAWCFDDEDSKKYYNFYTEKWADKIAGIERK